jgi:hypothetical protein
MTATNEFQKIVDTLTEGIKEQLKNNITSVHGVSTEQETDSSAAAEGFGFRPLTEEEKREFVNSLDAKGRQILTDLAGEARDSNDSAA